MIENIMYSYASQVVVSTVSLKLCYQSGQAILKSQIMWGFSASIIIIIIITKFLYNCHDLIFTNSMPIYQMQITLHLELQ